MSYYLADYQPRHQRPKGTPMLAKTEPLRTYLYGLLVPGLAVLVGYGIVSDSAVALWVAVGSAVLVPVGTELARAKVSPVAAETG